MTIDEIARARSLEVRDALTHLDRRVTDLLQQKQAAEDRLKRAGAELNKNRNLEGEAKRRITEADEKVAEIQRKVDEIEHQRSRLIDELMQLRSNRQELEKGTQVAKSAGQKLEADFRQARQESGSLEEEIRGLEEEKGRHATALRRAFLQAFREYQERVFGVIREALLGEEARLRRAGELDKFRRARHEDAQVGDLCDQRDQYRELLARPTLVPAVRDSLVTLLQNVENHLQQIYPMALTLDKEPAVQETVVDLCFFRDDKGRIVITLPIDEAAWTQLAEGHAGPASAFAAEIVWAVTKGLGLKPTDGEFSLFRGYCVYRADFGDEETTLLAATSVPLTSHQSFNLRFGRLPGEIEEAILDEAANA